MSSLDNRDIRTQMDVYTHDNIYLGTVRKIIPGPSTEQPQGFVQEPARQTSITHGELFGPAPTQPLGNRGPEVQSAGAGYATQPDATPLGKGAIVVGKWWGLVGRRTIPLDAVQSVSLERVVLKK